MGAKTKTTATDFMQVATRRGTLSMFVRSLCSCSLTRGCSAASLSLCVYLCVNCNASALIANDHETAAEAEAATTTTMGVTQPENKSRPFQCDRARPVRLQIVRYMCKNKITYIREVLFYSLFLAVNKPDL